MIKIKDMMLNKLYNAFTCKKNDKIRLIFNLWKIIY